MISRTWLAGIGPYPPSSPGWSLVPLAVSCGRTLGPASPVRASRPSVRPSTRSRSVSVRRCSIVRPSSTFFAASVDRAYIASPSAAVWVDQIPPSRPAMGCTHQPLRLRFDMTFFVLAGHRGGRSPDATPRGTGSPSAPPPARAPGPPPWAITSASRWQVRLAATRTRASLIRPAGAARTTEATSSSKCVAAPTASSHSPATTATRTPPLHAPTPWSRAGRGSRSRTAPVTPGNELPPAVDSAETIEQMITRQPRRIGRNNRSSSSPRPRTLRPVSDDFWRESTTCAEEFLAC